MLPAGTTTASTICPVPTTRTCPRRANARITAALRTAAGSTPPATTSTSYTCRTTL